MANAKNQNAHILLLSDAVRLKVLVKGSAKEAQRKIRAIAVLIRNTTWKCGKIERLVVDYLRRQLRRCGHAQTSIMEMLQYFGLSGKEKSEFLEAIRRLERRRIIRIERF